ncbi:hypothetical protein K3725_15145 [Leisingera sp. S132]|uniref:hypothetical protein n=1 Tax=Leisingera sp. S132 TaxID=2867016 RepID=UPI0021A8E5C1|nr:hypothetical protein [Leisingera sp. S132]UWQ78631.1 hypothetical protein K3725_15145 [Leisingera sp. S132]
MYVISLFLSHYVNWCNTVSETTPRWKINLAGLLFFAVAVALISFAPEEISLPVVFLGGAPVSLFFELDRRLRWKRAREMRAATSQLRKTRSLLKGFKR